SFLTSLFLFTAPSPTEIYTLSLHDALPISWRCSYAPTTDLRFAFRCEAFQGVKSRARHSPGGRNGLREIPAETLRRKMATPPPLDRKSTRLNSSHSQISYAVFCLKKKKNKK